MNMSGLKRFHLLPLVLPVTCTDTSAVRKEGDTVGGGKELLKGKLDNFFGSSVVKLV